MGNKKRGNIPPIVRDHAGYHITHTLNEKTKNHTGKISIYAGRKKKIKDDCMSVKEAIDYIDKLIENADKK
jgi:hypothetical protein